MFLFLKIVYCIIHKLFYNKENKEVINQELKEKYKKLNQEELNDQFIYACRSGHLEVIKYLIIDMSIDKTNYIEKYLNENKDKKYVQQAIELFNTRDLHYQLNENIKDNKERVKKIKI